MILAVDVGNTNVTLGGLDRDKVIFVSRISADTRKTRDEYAIMLRSILLLNKVAFESIEGAIISSVVPPLTYALQRAVEAVIEKKPMIIGPGIKTGLNILIDNPAQLGSDLVTAAVAALSKYPKPLVIIDMGTATTFSVIDSSGRMLGGLIFPGVRISHDALIANTSQLPRVGIEAPAKVVSSNTIECMQSGLIYGNAAMIDGTIDRIEAELGFKLKAIATGGLAEIVVPHCKRDVTLDENLILEGLRIIYEKNKKR